MHRIAVIYKNRPLMPMKSSRVNKFIKEKKGKICYDRKLKLHYLKLFVKPSDFKTQDIVLGLYPGSCFDGSSVVSKRNHHCNFELVQRAKKGNLQLRHFLKDELQIVN